ncbi:hypothetical protein SAMN02799624_05089 [Paenibacillus sp. UNC496MF]|nr:hypothetical protein SAMN02799624_05089 [Paenibacillus sp. UNC496MF]
MILGSGLLYMFGIIVIAWMQFRWMKMKASIQDYILVTIMYVGVATIGFLLILNVPIPSPSLFIKKWLMFMEM